MVDMCYYTNVLILPENGSEILVIVTCFIQCFLHFGPAYDESRKKYFYNDVSTCKKNGSGVAVIVTIFYEWVF